VDGRDKPGHDEATIDIRAIDRLTSPDEIRRP
jgi:hypothetical protein